ncbi:predicted protein [Naegleria gruberi]|uniref:Predicted protein n=1 Tax=Naegleria gruberi TaxID=5762 RepID=D2VH21_NAEGR|nr:uncharacterized protein NAEGRDRAFT_49522 [Naegleria gruberi]EFC43908.1 predicted protein [Naegleria gruberi]|eukprot:XP_002676652.1 predicted protein [Naegleria gruberi strain NEG-M]
MNRTNKPTTASKPQQPRRNKPMSAGKKRKMEEAALNAPTQQQKKVVVTETEEYNSDDEKIILHPIVEFLEQWKNDRSNWTFDGTKQRTLINQCLNAQIIDGKRFKYFLEYVAPLVGFDRVKLFETCREYVKTQRAAAQKNALHTLPSKERKLVLTDKSIRAKCVNEMKDILQDNKRYKRAKTVMRVLKATDKDSGSRYNLEDFSDVRDTDYEEKNNVVEKSKNENGEEETKENVNSDNESSSSSDSSSSSSDEE